MGKFGLQPILNTTYMQTTAIELFKHGPAATAFRTVEREIPEPHADEVIIEAEGFGLNYADVMARLGFYNDAPDIPSVIGYEVVGMVIKAGGSAGESLVGKRVTAFTRFGGYARHAITTVDACLEIGSDADMGEAMALTTQFGTAYYAMEHCAHLQEGSTIMLHAAAGGVGLGIIQLASLRNANILAMAGSAEKLQFLRSQGVEKVFNYRTADYVDWVRSETHDRGVDVAFNSVGGRTFKKDLKLLDAGGKLVLYGVADRSSGGKGNWANLGLVWKMGLLIPVQLMMRSVGIIGVNMLTIGDSRPDILRGCLEKTVELFNAGSIKPVVDSIFTPSDIGAAHARLESRESIGKIVVKW